MSLTLRFEISESFVLILLRLIHPSYPILMI